MLLTTRPQMALPSIHSNASGLVMEQQFAKCQVLGRRWGGAGCKSQTQVKPRLHLWVPTASEEGKTCTQTTQVYCRREAQERSEGRGYLQP